MISKVTKYLGEDNSSEIVLIPFPADYSPETTPLKLLNIHTKHISPLVKLVSGLYPLIHFQCFDIN